MAASGLARGCRAGDFRMSQRDYMPGTNMMTRAWAACGLLVMAAALTGCLGGSSPTEGNWSDPRKIDYYGGLHVNLARMTQTSSGTFYWDSIHGAGTVQAHEGDNLNVRYMLWLPDGTQIPKGQAGWSSVQTVTLNTSSLIPGWVHGLTGVVAGTTRQLVVPPAEGYGSLGSAPDIPPNATLVFLVEVDQVTPAATSAVLPASPPGALQARSVAARR